MKTSESIKAIAPAMVKAQSECKAAVKTAVNTFFNNAKYANLDSIIEATRESLASNKLAVIQAPIFCDDRNYVMTRIQHESGEYYETLTPLIFSKQDMQAYGSAITYAKRYALSSFLNISTDGDDDGNMTAVVANNTQQKQSAPKQNQASKAVDVLTGDSFTDYKINAGPNNKLTGTKLTDHTPDFLLKTVESSDAYHKSNNKVPHKNTKEFTDMVYAYLKHINFLPF